MGKRVLIYIFYQKQKLTDKESVDGNVVEEQEFNIQA